MQGEGQVPETLSSFVRSIVCGADPRSLKSEKCNRRVNSISEDLLYAAHHGKLKTGKHIKLGMTLKSVSSCRKVVDIINKCGHCCSYNVIESLETEATFFCSSKQSICPNGVQMMPNLLTSVAYDNFDLYVDTKSGSNTLHDTVGILTQNVRASDERNDDCESNTEYTRPPKMRRTFDAIAPEIPDYNRNPKVVEKLLPADHPSRKIFVHNLDFIKRFDLLWVLFHYFEIKNTPMWTGFLCKTVKDDSPM